MNCKMQYNRGVRPKPSSVRTRKTKTLAPKMLRLLLNKPHRTPAAAAVAVLSAGIAVSSSPSSNEISCSPTFSISLPRWHLPGIFPSSTPLFSAGSNVGSVEHSFTGSPAPPKDADSKKDDCKCCKGCLSRNSIANAASVIAPAVVNISVSNGNERSFGSGTIINPDGTILTCAHVVAHFRNGEAYTNGKVTVLLQDGRSFEGRVVNADSHSDVAIVKIKSNTPLPSAKLGKSAQLRQGDWVVALGCPLSLQNTITAGIIRKSSDLGFEGVGREFIQTDCAINKGNSGGPLVNLDGEIVGINIMKVFAADGLSFAVPIDTIAKIMEQFRKRGKVTRPWLGLKMLDLNAMIISQLKERDPKFPSVTSGVLVPMVIPGSPGSRAGFQANDVVISFDGKPVKSINEIVDIMGDRIGVPLRVKVARRGNKFVNLTVVPEEANIS